VTVIRPTIIAPTITTQTRPSAGVSIGITTRSFRTKRSFTWLPIAFTGFTVARWEGGSADFDWRAKRITPPWRR
jgi:hypothetical protein